MYLSVQDCFIGGNSCRNPSLRTKCGNLGFLHISASSLTKTGKHSLMCFVLYYDILNFVMLRRSAKEDISRIAEIIVFTKRQTYRDIFKNDDVSFNVIQVLREAEKYGIDGALDNMFVYDDGIVKAIITIKKYSDKIELSDFYVDPFFQNRGIGTKIMHLIIAEAKSECKRVCLDVLDKNISAVKFYENLGFKYTESKKEYEHSGFFLLHYEN